MDAGETSTKRQSIDESEENENTAVAGGGVGAVALIAAPNIVQAADIFKLDIDCFEEAFDYLLSKDLVSVGKTCKRLQQVAGYCFSQKFSAKWVSSRSDSFKAYFSGGLVDVSHFVQITRQVRISCFKGLKYLMNVQSKLRCLKQITISDIRITPTEVDRMTDVLSKLEGLRLTKCVLTSRAVIDHSSNLRRLAVHDCLIDGNWLDQKFPMMECFEFVPKKRNETESIEQIKQFLTQNPNIRKFATTADYLFANKDSIRNATDIKLDILAIKIEPLMEFDLLRRLLDELYECELYKRLQLYIPICLSREMLNQLITAKGLVKLHIDSTIHYYPLPTLTNLVELNVTNNHNIVNVESVVNSFPNLRRIHFEFASPDMLMPFIRRAPALEKIRVGKLWKKNHPNSAPADIDLQAMNQEREQLPNARKITVYVEEMVYLATKWALGETNFDLIRLIRYDSFEWQHDFGY